MCVYAKYRVWHMNENEAMCAHFSYRIASYHIIRCVKSIIAVHNNKQASTKL